LKTLIVTADDFGLTDALNAGIVEAHAHGIVTAASLMATGAAFEDAVERAHSVPSLELGAHLTLDDERPLVPGMRTLTDIDGRFVQRGELVRRLLVGRVDRTEVERCWRAEIERCLSAGILPAFLNSHGHVHAFPTLLPIAVRLAREYRIRAVRRPVEALWASRPASAGHAVRGLVVSGAALWSFGRDARSDVGTTSAFRGLAASGRNTTARLSRECNSLSDGVTELMVHPGREDAVTRERYGHWHYRWEEELRALLEVHVDRRVLTTFQAEFPV
jgi:predicted glycoside hydrolase/deacetylase ChbG (UPF0249 family)